MIYLTIQLLMLLFQIPGNCYCYILVPQSEAVVERGFSYMKLILTDKRTNLDSESLEALVHLPYRNKSKEANNIIEIWQSCCSRRIFANNYFKGCRNEGSVFDFRSIM